MFRSQTSRCVPRLNNGHRLIPASGVRYNTIVRLFSRSAVISQNVPFRIDGEGTGVAQTISVHGSPHRIRVDAYPSFGGNDSAPTPLAFSLSSLGSCTQVTGSLVARDLGIQLGKWNVTVKGDLPTAVLVKGEQGNSNWDNIELEVRVQTNVQDDAFQKFAEETERRCPITQLFKRSGTGWKSHWVNDKV